MSEINGLSEFNFSNVELMTAESILKEVDPNRFNGDNYYSVMIEGKAYGKEFDGGKIRKSQFINCDFNEVEFIGTAGSTSSLIDCRLNDCHIKNAGLDFCNFSKTFFLGSTKKTIIESTSFSHNDFTDSVFQNVNCSGSNFENAYFKNTRISDSIFEHCNFENALFDNIHLENIDMSKTGLDFVECRGLSLKNVKLPYLGVLQMFDGLNNIYHHSNEVIMKFPNSTVEVKASDFLGQIDQLQAYFFDKKDYFILANINIFLGQQKKAYYYTLEGLKYSLGKKDFRMIRYLCKLASLNCFFTKEQLHRLYHFMHSNECIQSLTDHEYQVYLYEMVIIKRLLIDNPFGMPQLILTIETDILPQETKTTADLLTGLSQTVDDLAPQASSYITLRHNSPNVFEIFSSDSIQSLFNLLSTMSTFLSESNSIISAIKGFINFNQQNKEKKLDNQLKQQQIQKNQHELDALLPPEELRNIERIKQMQDIEAKQLDNAFKLIKLQKELGMRQEQDPLPLEENDAAVPWFSSKNSVMILDELRHRIQTFSYSIQADEPLPAAIRKGIIKKRDTEWINS